MDKVTFKLFVSRKLSKKGSSYVALFVDLGYAVRPLTFDVALVSEITGLPVGSLSSMPLDEKRYVG